MRKGYRVYMELSKAEGGYEPPMPVSSAALFSAVEHLTSMEVDTTVLVTYKGGATVRCTIKE